jgi:hypothetical protein
MSITVKSAPGTTPSAHENLWHVADSTNKAASDFQYVWDIYKGGVLQARLKTRPEGANDYGKIDASLVVRSLLADSVPPSLNYEAFGAEGGIGTDVLFTTYTMAVGEYASGVTSGNLVSGNYTAYNYTGKDIAPASGSVLSNRPLQSTTVAGQPLVFTWFAVSGDSYRVDRTQAGTTDNFTKTATTPFVVSLPCTNTSADSMTLAVSGGVTYNFKVLCQSKYKPRTLLFLNRMGGWDSYTFALKSQRSIDAERKMFQQNDWALVGDNMVNTYNTYTRRESRKVYATQYRTSIELNAYQTTTQEYTWLEELVTSPAVYLWDSTADVWIPCMVTDTNYRPIDVLLDKGETLKLTIELSKQDITQYR